MRLDEVTQLAGGLCLHFANGDIKHMDVEEGWDAVDKLTVALDKWQRDMEARMDTPEGARIREESRENVINAFLGKEADVLPFHRRRK